ncbi:MAG TPA: asparagine synthase (glutamine-hydrolyzing) [Casimicrobiaceae bacterium]|nr:asparagine synthase (glutamine-hydrolyzing) [Casimicrobiaceae bacterium]
MCGIVGRVGAIGPLGDAESLLRRQLASLHHRGPDDSGCAIDRHWMFGHARLAIIDPEHGQQPFASADGQLVITFNGEIYNYLELREELVGAGHAFRTTSDTEVLLTGFRQWGEAVLDRIDGMFAFAIYDKTTQTLFCARDPYGQKPFFYHEDGGTLSFSSECRTFELLPGWKRDVDPASLADFLAFESLPFDRSIFRGIRKLPPGYCLRYANGRVAIRRYFESVPSDGPPSATPADTETEVHALLREAVRRTFRADVPVGLLLSGGLDSTMVLALLREVHPAVSLRSFTIRNVDASFDESAAAATVAKTFETAHTIVTAEPATLATIASDLPARLDEPQADPGILPKFLICREIARSNKVALTGDGGDEFFYGYAIFNAQRAARYAKLLPGALHRQVIRPLTQALPASSRYMSIEFRLKQFAKGFPAPDHLRNFYWTCAFADHELPHLLRSEHQDLTDLREQFERLHERWNVARGPIGRIAYLYQQQYLPDYVLANSDRASMQNSVELRTPFLATDLVRKLNSLPDSIKMRGGTMKSLLRSIARKTLPPEIARRRKMGFTSPVAALIRGPLKQEVMEYLGEGYLRRQGLFREAYVAGLLDDHFANRHNRYKQIWILFMLQKWLHARGLNLR